MDLRGLLLLTGWVCLTLTATGCQRAEELTFSTSEAVQELPDPLRKAVEYQLHEHTGTYRRPKMLGDPDMSLEHLKHGQAVYQRRCAQCHGVNGDGLGPAAAAMYPRPRDYRRGIFKFTSTPYGSKPLRADLVRTIKRGVRGTSMPSFRLLPPKDIDAVVDYVLMLTHRGEFEEQLAYAAEVDEEVDPDYVPDMIDTVLGSWERAARQEVRPLTPQPAFTAENVIAGKQAFLSQGCSKCHGEDGRGQTRDNIGKDTWGHTTRAADLTSGMLHGGTEPFDIYRRIYSGINGTPMPSFASAFRENPDTIWDLVAYVLYVSNRRRAGELPPPGFAKPYVPEDERVDVVLD